MTTVPPASDSNRVRREPPSVAATPSSFWLVMQVWGEAYTHSLTEIALPALLSPGNIPALAESRRTILKLYTTEADMARIASAPAFNRLRQYVEVEYSPLEDAPGTGKSKYAAMTAIHRRLVAEAYDAQSALVWLLPDTVWADGSLRVVARAAAAGKRAVMQAGIRVTKSTALPALRDLLTDRTSAPVGARELVRLALDHMHPYYRAWYWDAPEFNRNPANVFWRTDDAGMVIRAFHLHPLMLFPERRVRHFISTFDDDLPLLACPAPESIYIAADSDEIFHIDLAEDDWCPRIPMLERRPSAAYLAQWAWRSANQHHRRFVRHAIHVHAAPLTWRARAVEVRSGVIIAIASGLLTARAMWARGIDLLFGFRTDWPGAVAAGTSVGAGLRPTAARWWRQLVGSCPRSRRGARLRRHLNSVYTSALVTAGARTLGRNVMLRGLGISLQAWKRSRRRFPRTLNRLLGKDLSWKVARRRLFWYVLFRSTWADRHATRTMVRHRVRQRIRSTLRRSVKPVRYALKKTRGRIRRRGAQWVRTGRRVRARLTDRRWTRPARLAGRRLRSRAIYAARLVRRLPRLALRATKAGVRVGCMRPGRHVAHRLKTAAHAALIWRKGAPEPGSQPRPDSTSEPV